MSKSLAAASKQGCESCPLHKQMKDRRMPPFDVVICKLRKSAEEYFNSAAPLLLSLYNQLQNQRTTGAPYVSRVMNGERLLAAIRAAPMLKLQASMLKQKAYRDLREATVR